MLQPKERIRPLISFVILLTATFLFSGAQLPHQGGTIVTATFTDVKTFNTLLTTDSETHTYSRLLHSGLVSLNPVTQVAQPSLAESWEISPDELVWNFHLRKGLKWSDGQPFSADDVLFTMQLINDKRVAAVAHDSLGASGEILWSKQGDYLVQAKLPSKFVTFLRHLEPGTCPILPKHKWEKAYLEGRFPEMMRPDMNPADLVGLGPFILKSYTPGQKLVLTRNPEFWKTDARGNHLPYLDEIVFLIMGNQDQIALKIESGELDTYQNIRAGDLQRLRAKQDSLQLNVINVGPSLDMEGFFFNQNPGHDPVKLTWFRDVNFRRAVSYLIDRKALSANCFYGQAFPAYGPESPGNIFWFNPSILKHPFDPPSAQKLLRKSGFRTLKNDDGKPVLLDSKGNRVRFSLFTNAGNSIRNAEAVLIVSDLAKAGMEVNYSSLDFAELVARVNQTFDYDAALLNLTHDDPDPDDRLNSYLSKGSLHFWQPRQPQPFTSWEKRIDELMALTMSKSDRNERKRYYDEVQKILAEQQPMIFTVHPYVFVCAKKKIGNLKPTISRHRTLWNAEELYWKQ